MGDDDAPWTIDDFFYGARPESEYALISSEELEGILDAYYHYWVRNDVSLIGVSEWIHTKLHIPNDPNLSWRDVERQFRQEQFRMQRIRVLLKDRDLYNNDAALKLQELDRTRTSLRDFMLANFKCHINIANIHGVYDTEGNDIDENVRTLLDHDPKKLNAFQSLYMKLMDVLMCWDLRRAGDKFFERVRTKAGLDTPSFVELQDIRTFIYEHTKIEDNFAMWEEVTRNSSVFPQLLDYLCTRPLTEAQELEENAHLRSYDGDKYGRFAVIYDCKQDMAWPLMGSEYWKKLAMRMNEVRERTFGYGNFEPCVPPDRRDVCIQHMMADFTHDIVTETLDVPNELFTMWREVHEFECRHRGAVYEIRNAPLRRILDATFPLNDEGLVGDTSWGRNWQVVANRARHCPELQEFTFKCAPELRASMEERVLKGQTINNLEYLEGCHCHSKLTLTDIDGQHTTFVPLCTHPQRRRVHISPDEWRASIGDVASGLVWYRVTDDFRGSELVNVKLADALARREQLLSDEDRAWRREQTFTKREWKSFHVMDALTHDTYVRVDVEAPWRDSNGEPVTWVSCYRPRPAIGKGLDAFTFRHWVRSTLGLRWDRTSGDLPKSAKMVEHAALRGALESNDSERPETCTFNLSVWESLGVALCLKWRCVSTVPAHGIEFTHEGLSAALGLDVSRTGMEFTQEEWTNLAIAPVLIEHYIKVDDWYYCVDDSVKYYIRVRSGNDMVCMVAGHRYYRPHTGRAWDDCLVQPIEHIYKCQKFSYHDHFGIYACKGRTLFRVGELDGHQFTLMQQGIGGCGKSTVMKLMQLFWPFHRMGILSSNIEPKFGMSQVLNEGNTLAIFCNEVSKDLNLNQEEWQTSCSGEMGSYAVKHKSPLVTMCKAQHMWVGNGFPTHFKNNQRQVSRRIMGVMMEQAIRNRDGGIFKQITSSCGTFQRCIVLAYREFLMQYGTIDPMSVPETLPPAFKRYYDEGCRQTQPVEDFIANSDSIMAKEDGHMLLSTFKELMNNYLMKHDSKRIIGFGREHYLTPFTERGITVSRRQHFDIGGTPHSNVDVIVGLCEVQGI